MLRINEYTKDLISVMKSVTGNKTPWFAGVNGHNSKGLYIHFAAWTVSADTVYVFHVNTEKGTWKDVILETMEFLHSNDIIIKGLNHDREQPLYTDVSMVAISHIPLEFIKEYTGYFVSKFGVPATADNTYDSRNVAGALKDTAIFEDYRLRVLRAITNITERADNGMVIWEPMFSDDTWQLVSDQLVDYMGSETEHQFHCDVLKPAFKTMEAFWHPDQLQHMAPHILNFIEDPTHQRKADLPPHSRKEKKLSKTLTVLQKLLIDKVPLKLEHNMLGFEYDVAFRPGNATWYQNIITDISDGLTYHGTFQNPYALSSNIVKYMPIPMSQRTLTSITNLFPIL